MSLGTSKNKHFWWWNATMTVLEIHNTFLSDSNPKNSHKQQDSPLDEDFWLNSGSEGLSCYLGWPRYRTRFNISMPTPNCFLWQTYPAEAAYAGVVFGNINHNFSSILLVAFNKITCNKPKADQMRYYWHVEVIFALVQ